MSFPALFTRLCDNTVLSATNDPVGEVAAAHLELVRHSGGRMAGPLLLPADALTEAAGFTRRMPEGVLPICLQVAAPEQVAKALDAAFDTPGVRLEALHVRALGLDPDETVAGVADALSVLSGVVPVFWEPLGSADQPLDTLGPWWRTLTGGPQGLAVTLGSDRQVSKASAVSNETVAEILRAAAGAEVPLKLYGPGVSTPGLLNLLLATHLARLGADTVAVTAALEVNDQDGLVRSVTSWTGTEVAAIRRCLVAVGSSDPSSEVVQLRERGLLTAPRLRK